MFLVFHFSFVWFFFCPLYQPFKDMADNLNYCNIKGRRPAEEVVN